MEEVSIKFMGFEVFKRRETGIDFQVPRALLELLRNDPRFVDLWPSCVYFNEQAVPHWGGLGHPEFMAVSDPHSIDFGRMGANEEVLGYPRTKFFARLREEYK